MKPETEQKAPAEFAAKAAEVRLCLKADSGFTSTTSYRVSAIQWGEIIAVCEDGEERRVANAAPDGLAFAEWVLAQGDCGNLWGGSAGEMRKRAAEFIAKARAHD